MLHVARWHAWVGRWPDAMLRASSNRTHLVFLQVAVFYIVKYFVKLSGNCLHLSLRWKTASGGKFGYSVQRDIWNQQQKRWAKFIKQLDWVGGEYNIYKKWPAEFNYTQDAPRGHLPLTNALRGTQVRSSRRLICFKLGEV